MIAMSKCFKDFEASLSCYAVGRAKIFQTDPQRLDNDFHTFFHLGLIGTHGGQQLHACDQPATSHVH